MLSNLTKINPQFADEDVEDIINNSGDYDSYESFIAEAYNKKGQKIKYDSKTGKIIYDNSGFMFTASKYLFLLILILF